MSCAFSFSSDTNNLGKFYSSFLNLVFRFHWMALRPCMVSLDLRSFRFTRHMALLIDCHPLILGELFYLWHCFACANCFSQSIYYFQPYCFLLLFSPNALSFNQLDLPEYTSKEQLQERLLLAIHEASEGFGFG